MVCLAEAAARKKHVKHTTCGDGDVSSKPRSDSQFCAGISSRQVDNIRTAESPDCFMPAGAGDADAISGAGVCGVVSVCVFRGPQTGAGEVGAERQSGLPKSMA